MKLTKKLLDTWEKDCGGLPLQRSHTRLARVIPFLRQLLGDWIPYDYEDTPKIEKTNTPKSVLVLLKSGKVKKATYINRFFINPTKKNYYLTVKFFKYI